MADTMDKATEKPDAERVAEMVARMHRERLSLPFPIRLPLGMGIGGVSGFLLGLAKGLQDSGFVYQAENAHRVPTTQTGWYFYHKSKNYNMMLGGMKQGFKQGFRYSAWVGLYFLLEESVDRGRATGRDLWSSLKSEVGYGHSVREEVDERTTTRDCFSSMLAGLGTAGIFSAWNRFPIPTTARTAKLGAKAGLIFGFLQDAVGLLRRRRVGYIEFFKQHVIGKGSQSEVAVAT